MWVFYARASPLSFGDLNPIQLEHDPKRTSSKLYDSSCRIFIHLPVSISMGFVKGADMIGRLSLFLGVLSSSFIIASQSGYAETDDLGIYRFMRSDAPETTGSLPKSRGTGGTTRMTLNHPVSSSDFQPLIRLHAEANGLPFELADAVVIVESRYNPHARNGPSYGLAQINLRTARGLGYGGGATGLFDPETNLRFAMKYLAQAYRMANGDTCGTVMRYQNGTGSRRFTGANRAYCSKVKAHLVRLGDRRHDA
jgi:hypothetical protein